MMKILFSGQLKNRYQALLNWTTIQITMWMKSTHYETLSKNHTKRQAIEKRSIKNGYPKRPGRR